MGIKGIQEFLGEDWSKVEALLRGSLHSSV